MINETLAFARDDFAEEAKVNLDSVSLVRSLVESIEDMGYNVQLYNSRFNRISLLRHSTALKQAFTNFNLLSNAVRCAKNVTVRIRCHHNRVNIYIEDDGPGIEEKELEQVFESFYRGELPFT
ncbi:sensor histidine kinase [Candidatus Coxiella mudrowiae]|uniref:sensor histidine kinase n=1 Tax=Candidatus Coxiella mudrowiae TaxID=2054173 RepID=UPI001F23B4EF|nr:sensor histidine kinase [Candidatus Coxiella mudrowiae]